MKLRLEKDLNKMIFLESIELKIISEVTVKVKLNKNMKLLSKKVKIFHILKCVKFQK